MRQAAVLDDIRAKIARIEGVSARHDVIPIGIEDIDSRIPARGIATGALHELAGSPELADDASATIFLAGILARCEGPVFWCLRWRDLPKPTIAQVQGYCNMGGLMLASCCDLIIAADDALFADLSDGKVECLRRLYGEDFLVDESVWKGRAPGRPFGLEGGDRPLAFRLLHVIEFAGNGDIKRENVWVDLATIMQQLPQG